MRRVGRMVWCVRDGFVVNADLVRTADSCTAILKERILSNTGTTQPHSQIMGAMGGTMDMTARARVTVAMVQGTIILSPLRGMFRVVIVRFSLAMASHLQPITPSLKTITASLQVATLNTRTTTASPLPPTTVGPIQTATHKAATDSPAGRH